MSALQDALAHHQAGRHRQAEELYARILATDPAEPTALYLSGMLHVELGRIRPATERLTALAAVQPRHVESQLALAKLHVLAGDGDAAIACFARVTALAPDHSGALIGLGEVLLAAGRPGDAIAPLRQAGALVPGEDRVWIGLSRALLAAGQPAEALAVIERVESGIGDAGLVRGACLKALYRLDEAAAVLRQVVAFDPRRAVAQLNLGTVHAEREDFAAAERHLRLAIGCDPTSAEAHASLGSVLLLTGHVAAAEDSFCRALTYAPDLVAAHQNLAAILTARREHGTAQHHRDMAYRRQNLFVEQAPTPRRTVLLPATAGGGNVPAQFLLPREEYTRITWLVEYATPDQPARLPPHDLVFNTIGDPDMAAGTEAPMAAFLAAGTQPMLNHPAQIARTRRDHLPALLAGLPDVVVPEVRRLPPGATLEDIPLPCLVRPAGSHGGQEVMLVASAAQRDRITIQGPQDCYVTGFHDYRSADGRYRKYRFIYVDREPFAYHLAIGAQWLVHYVTADMSEPAKQAEEHRFLTDPAAVLGARGLQAIRAIGQRLDLDFCGADLTLLPDGRVLVFEANATMLVHPEDGAGPLAYKNQRINEILTAFRLMVGKTGSD